MRRAFLFAALSGCSFDYEALSGTGPGGEDYQDYRDVVDTCDSGWSLIFGADFDDPDEDLRDRWELPESVVWQVDEGELVGQFPGSGEDYWTTHIVARELAVRDLWMRADVVTALDRYPLLQARVDPAAGDRRFYGLRLRGDLAGIEIFPHGQPENLDCSVDPACETTYFDPVAEDTTYRLVFTVRTDAGAVRVAGALYALDADGEPGADPIGDATRTFTGAEAIDLEGSIGLSAWQGESRFDNVFVAACD